MHPEMRGQERVAKGPGCNREVHAAANHGLPALGLVGPQEDSGAVERQQGTLEAVLPDELRQIAPRAARVAEELGVRTPGLPIDRAPDEVQKDGLARAKALGDHGARGVGACRTSKEAGEAQQQASAAAEVPGAVAPGTRG
jgi:hypothetical protein